jgi:hypothetical protein
MYLKSFGFKQSTGKISELKYFCRITYDQFQKGSTVVQDEVWKSSCGKEKYQQMKW